MDISFDDDNPDLTLDAPTTPLNNMSLKPSDFKSRAYGFTYAELASKDYYNGGTRYGRSPIHGDYGLYKSGNLSGISANGKTDIFGGHTARQPSTTALTKRPAESNTDTSSM